MARSRKTIAKKTAPARLAGYDDLFADVAEVIEEARRSAARSVNAVMTATYSGSLDAASWSRIRAAGPGPSTAKRCSSSFPPT
jgi:hypothetical protein